MTFLVDMYSFLDPPDRTVLFSVDDRSIFPVASRLGITPLIILLPSTAQVEQVSIVYRCPRASTSSADTARRQRASCAHVVGD